MVYAREPHPRQQRRDRFGDTPSLAVGHTHVLLHRVPHFPTEPTPLRLAPRQPSFQPCAPPKAPGATQRSRAPHPPPDYSCSEGERREQEHVQGRTKAPHEAGVNPLLRL